MTPEDIDRVYSNDYVDFMINYSGNTAILEQYKDSIIDIINFYFAIVHMPASHMTEDVISRMGYAAIPLLFGLTSMTSIESSGIQRIRSIPNFNLRGKGVLIGFIDTGIDYTNPIFQYADKTTRIAVIWDQSVMSGQLSEGIPYGTEYTREQINEALKSNDPYSIVPLKDEIGHGTMVAGIAAGNEVPERGFYGVAPDSELVIVKLKNPKPYLKEFFRVPPDAICYQENDLIIGMQYLFNYASRNHKPIVLCITTDTSQYAHDGRGTISNWLSIQAANPGNAIIIPVGNEGNARRHYYGIIEEAKKFDTVELNVGPGETGFSMEFWGTSPNIFTIDILTPSGEYYPRLDIRINESRKISFIFDPTIINVDYHIVESRSGDQMILLRFSRPSQGIWKFNVYGRGIYPMNFHIWLPMDHFITYETYFIRSDPYTTLLSLACAGAPITVTAYNTDNDSLFIDAGRGYTRIDYVKPDIAAPGINILSPTLDHDFTPISGTSASAAYTAGAAAMLFEWAIVNKNYPKMTSQDMKIFMIRGAKRKPDTVYPNRDWGYGILDVFNIFESIRRSQV